MRLFEERSTTLRKQLFSHDNNHSVLILVIMWEVELCVIDVQNITKLKEVPDYKHLFSKRY